MTIELNTLSPKKWNANYSGSAPTIDITDGVLVGDFAVDTSNDAIWQCTDNTDTTAVWVLQNAGGAGGTAQGTDGTYDIEPANDGATDGNARGENSVDLCTKRAVAAYVCAGANSGAVAGENSGGTGTHSFYGAGLNSHTNTGNYCSFSGDSNSANSGNWCTISGKNNHTNSGNYCSISGGGYYGNHSNSGYNCSISGYNNHTNSGSYCDISGSYNNSNSGEYCTISGGHNYTNSGLHCSISGQYNTANTGNNCSISGGNASSNNLDYARVHGGSVNARIIDLVAKASTANTTPKAITLGGAAEGAVGSIVIPADTAWAFTVHVVAIDVTNGFANSKKFSFDGLCLNDGGTVTVTSATLGTDTTQGTFTGSVALSADTTNDALRIMATGIGTDTIRWTARVELTQAD